MCGTGGIHTPKGLVKCSKIISEKKKEKNKKYMADYIPPQCSDDTVNPLL